MKKILALALTVATSLTLSGCFFSSTECKYDDLFENEVHGVRNNVFTFSDDDTQRIDGVISDMYSLIQKDSSALFMSYKFNSYFEEMCFVQEQYGIINVYSSMFPTNEDIIEDKLNVKTYYLELVQDYYNFLIAFTKSQHVNSFFGDSDYSWITDREDLYDDEYYELEQKQAVLSIEYETLLAVDELDIDLLSAKLVEIVEVDNDIAFKLGYDNYLDYMYEDGFNREYVYSDLSIMKNSVKSNVVDTIETLELAFDEYDNSTKAHVSSLSSGSYFDNNSHFEDLATYMDGDYLKYFNHFWSNGEYYFGNDNSQKAAYMSKTMSQNFTMAYFGPGAYSSLSTVTHEVGHYMAAQVDYVDGSYDNIDLCEAQAQANEMLLSAFMYTNDDSDIYKLYALSELRSGLSTILASLIVSDFEYEIYTKNNLIASDVSTIMSGIYANYDVEDMFRDSDEYWPVVFRYTSGYYISYGISILPALELFFETIDDLAQGKADYFVILNGQSQLLSVIDDLEYSDPLTEDVVLSICNKIKSFI